MAFDIALLEKRGYWLFLFFLHRSEQYFISVHTFSHFFRQLNDRLQLTQTLEGRFFLLPLNDFTASLTKK